jgi:hypothetical protein
MYVGRTGSTYTGNPNTDGTPTPGVSGQFYTGNNNNRLTTTGAVPSVETIATRPYSSAAFRAW